jgi:hypothetical protein
MGYEIVFDDDSSGEAADLVCLKEEADTIQLALVHCKFSQGANPGERVKDVVEVCSQAVKSNRWTWKFSKLCDHIGYRQSKLSRGNCPTRFVVGSMNRLNQIRRASRFKKVSSRIYVVQPGLSKTAITEDQSNILAAAHGYLLETIGVGLSVICSN